MQRQCIGEPTRKIENWNTKNLNRGWDDQRWPEGHEECGLTGWQIENWTKWSISSYS